MNKTSTLLQNQLLNKGTSQLETKLHVFPDVASVNRTKQTSNGTDVARKSTKYDYVMKVILLGDQGVGKTSFTKALRIHPDVKKVDCTCRVAKATDHLEVEVLTSLGKTALVRLCDTGGQERYRSLTSSYYRGAHGALLMFDLKQQKSIDSVETWLTDLDTFSAASSCTRILLGSNCTSQDRKILPNVGRKYAENRGLLYMEFDASQFYNVIESLQLIVDRVAKEVTIVPENTHIIKPTPNPFNGNQNDEFKQFTCLC